MLSGREALGQIDGTLGQVKGEVAELGARLGRLNETEQNLRRRLAEALEGLARMRLDEGHRGELESLVGGAGRAALEVLADRERALAEQAERERSIAERLADLEARRGEAAEALEAASEALDAAEAELQEQLEADQAHKAQLAKVEAAEAVFKEADAKRALAEEDRKTKGAPYEADPLFSYLWARGYGTAAYRGSGPVRMLDAWVAALVRFEEARRNYHMLTEIPRRLKDHAARMRALADAEVDALVAIEKAARDQSPAPQLEEKLKGARGVVEALDAEIGSVRASEREAAEARAAFDRGEDADFRRATAIVADALETESVAELRRQARKTPMPEDDRLVAEMVEAEDGLEDISHERDHIAGLQRAAERRMAELADMRVEFRRRRYDDYASSFDDRALFATLLGEFIRGAITGAAYWERLDRHHRRRPRRSKSDFGSGRFRFPGPLSFPGSRGGGGFRTGGGISSGGFRTGGGF